MSKIIKVFHTPDYFSEKYENYYNNDHLSDLKVKFEGSESIESILNCHKIVLYTSCDCKSLLTIDFEKLIKNSKNDVIIIPKEENEELVTNFIKFIYRGSLDASNNKELISFLTYSEKFGLKDLKEFKQLSQQDLLEGILTYTKLDFQNRFYELDKMLEKQVNFKKISQEQLLKTYKKNKWLQHSPFYLNQIVKKEVNDDTEYGYTPTKFIKSYCTGNVTLSKGNTVASYTYFLN
jgi:hypothetical protein